jgi:cytochrome c oxidase subunit 2
MLRRKGPASLALALLALAGCRGEQTVFDPVSDEARNLLGLIWLFVGVCGVVWVLVVATLLAAIWRRRGGDPAPEADSPRQIRRKTSIAGALVGVTAAILVMFTLVSFAATHGVESQNAPLTIKVTGQQWWWQVEYQSADPTQLITTANEIHIPVGRPVRLQLEASDVIHSFWAPNLMGKQDLIPGRDNYLTISADRPGVFRGQCAEFCGLQHANMAFLVIAQPPAAFEAWRQKQLQPAAPPTDPLHSRGRQVFLNAPCVACHTIQGEVAGSRVGPDLTHLSSRATLAAGALTNTPANLDRWLADPQSVKPGNNMPRVPLSPADRGALVAYLEELK